MARLFGFSPKKNMKNSRTRAPKRLIQFNNNKPRPEIRDNLDHREGEEQEFKGDDVTHNKKANHNKKNRKKK